MYYAVQSNSLYVICIWSLFFAVVALIWEKLVPSFFTASEILEISRYLEGGSSRNMTAADFSKKKSEITRKLRRTPVVACNRPVLHFFIQ